MMLAPLNPVIIDDLRHRASRLRMGVSNFGCSFYRGRGTYRLYLPSYRRPQILPSRTVRKRAAARSHQSRKGFAA